MRWFAAGFVAGIAVVGVGALLLWLHDDPDRQVAT